MPILTSDKKIGGTAEISIQNSTKIFKSVPCVRTYFLDYMNFQDCIWEPMHSFKLHNHALNTFNALFRDC